MIRSTLKSFAFFGMWFLPGLLLWAAYPPMDESKDIFIALAPLLVFARQMEAKKTFKVWFVNAFAFWFATLAWMPAIVKNGGPWSLVALGWIGLSAYCALYFGAAGWCIAKGWAWARDEGSLDGFRCLARPRYFRRLLMILFAEPVFFAGFELVRSRFGGGFAWNHLGTAMANLGFSAPAAIGGVYLLSVIVILVNGTIASIAERMLEPVEAVKLRRGLWKVPRWARSLETVLPFLAVWGFYSLGSACVIRPADPSEGAEGRALTVAMVQRNFPCAFNGEKRESPLKAYSRLLGRIAALKPDLVVLPESAAAEIGELGGARVQAFADWVRRETGALAVLIGGSRGEDGREYNSAALYQAAGGGDNKPTTTSDNKPTTTSVQIYDKVHLVPFGEYIPGDKIVTALQRLAPVGSCTPGELRLLNLAQIDECGESTGASLGRMGRMGLLRPETTETSATPQSGNQPINQYNRSIGQSVNRSIQSTNRSIEKSINSPIPLGVAICYEDTDSAQMRELAAKGAEALVFITNDSWFSNSIEPVQHAQQAALRAVETGLTVVRCGNSGVTGVIRSDGKASWLIDQDGEPLVDEEGVMCDRIDIPVTIGSIAAKTPYVILGDIPLVALFLLLITTSIVIKYYHEHQKRRYLSL